MPPSRVLDMMSAKIRIGQKISDSIRQIPGANLIPWSNSTHKMTMMRYAARPQSVRRAFATSPPPAQQLRQSPHPQKHY